MEIISRAFHLRIAMSDVISPTPTSFVADIANQFLSLNVDPKILSTSSHYQVTGVASEILPNLI